MVDRLIGFTLSILLLLSFLLGGWAIEEQKKRITSLTIERDEYRDAALFCEAEIKKVNTLVDEIEPVLRFETERLRQETDRLRREIEQMRKGGSR